MTCRDCNTFGQCNDHNGLLRPITALTLLNAITIDAQKAWSAALTGAMTPERRREVEARYERLSDVAAVMREYLGMEGS